MLIALGDLDLHDSITEVLRTHGGAHVFQGVAERLSTADVRLANLETVIVGNPQDLLKGRACLVAPLAALDSLRAARIDAVTFANNHVLDMGPDGVIECLSHLQEIGIAVAGAGSNASEARRPAVIERNGVQFRIFAYSYGCGQLASRSRAGCAEAKLDLIVRDISRTGVTAGVTVVSLHIDAEFQVIPSPNRVELCRKVAEAGADIVLCHHPHVMQGIEKWGSSLIVYSLGNYVTPVSDYMRAHSNECHLSFHIEIQCNPGGVVAAEVVPIVIESSGRPTLASVQERERILHILAERSSALSDEVRIRRNYEMMVKAWSVRYFDLIYWSLRKRDWPACRRLVADLWHTPTKRRWLWDFVYDQVRRAFHWKVQW